MMFGNPRPTAAQTVEANSRAANPYRRRPLFGAPMLGGADDMSEALAPSTAQTAPVPDMGALAPTTHPEMGGVAGAPPYSTPFGPPGMGGNPGDVGGGITPVDVTQPLARVDAFSATASKPKFFDEGGVGRAIVGGLGDALSTFGGGRAMYAPMMAQRYKAAMEAAQYQRERADKFSDFQREHDYKRKNPLPSASNNDTVADYEFIASKLGVEAAQQFLRSQGDPMVTLQLPGNRVYNGPRSGLAAAMGAGAAPAQAAGVPAADGGPPPGSVVNGMRFKGGDYRSPQSWEPEGGAASQGAGTFR